MQRTRYHRPHRGSYGDCLECCLASQLDLKREAVPEFSLGLDDASDRSMGEYLRRARAWLAPIGYSLWAGFSPARDLPSMLAEQEWLNPGVRYILCGGAKTEGVNHAVCVKAGKIEHDPFHTRARSIKGPLWPEQRLFGILVVRETI